MGILDQLREQASQKQSSDFEQKNLEQQLAQNYQQDILPRMQEAFRFMQEIVRHLNFLAQAVEVESYSNRYPQLGKLTQTDYKINTDGFSGFADYDRLMQINVSFFCIGDGEFYLKREGKNLIEQEVAFLTSKKVPFDWSPIQGVNGAAAAQIKIQRRIPVRFRFEVDYRQSKINLLINNHTNFDAYKKTFAPHEVNAELLDEIARFMLRKDYDFIRLEITSQQKQEIRQKAEDFQRQQHALRQQIRMEEEKAKAATEKSFLNRIRPLKKRKPSS